MNDTLVAATAASDRIAHAWSRWGPSRKVGTPLARWKPGTQEADLQTTLDGWTALPDEETERARAWLRSFADRGGRSLLVTDPAYPPQLRGIENPPLVLHVAGDASLLPQGHVAVVGSRDHSQSAAAQTQRMVAYLAGRGVAVVTGLARGIDDVATRAARDAAGRVVGVAPGGPLDPIPRSCRDAYRMAWESGAVVSEVTGQDPITKTAFLRRNRITSGLSRLVLVMSARAEGGTFNQLEWADRQGVPCLIARSAADPGLLRLARRARWHFEEADAFVPRCESLWATGGARQDALAVTG